MQHHLVNYSYKCKCYDTIHCVNNYWKRPNSDCEYWL